MQCFTDESTYFQSSLYLYDFYPIKADGYNLTFKRRTYIQSVLEF